MRIAVGLLHWPVYDRQKQVVATNITNLDVHDIARACKVYGVEKYYLIHPSAEQLMFVSRLLDHWRVGDGAKFNPKRKTALSMVHTAENLDAALRDWDEKSLVVATSAQAHPEIQGVGFHQLKEQLQNPAGSAFLLFGTGFGMTPEALAKCQFLLEPLRGATAEDYRHLSVRSAVSICLDRLLGSW